VFQRFENFVSPLVGDIPTKCHGAKRIVYNSFFLEEFVEEPPANCLIGLGFGVAVQSRSRTLELLGDVTPAPSYRVGPHVSLKAAVYLAAEVVLENPVGDDDISSIRVLGMPCTYPTHCETSRPEDFAQLLGDQRGGDTGHLGQASRGDA